MEVKDQPPRVETVDQQVLAGDTVQQQGVYCNGPTTYHTRYTHVHHVPYAEHVESSIGRNGEVRSRQHHAVLRLSRSRVSE